MARQVLENGVVLPSEYSDDWYDDMTSNLTKLDDVIGSDSEKLSSADVGAAALSNNYNDLDNLPTIPTVNDATLTIQKNGTTVNTFTANASSNVTANIIVPTKTSDLTNDSNFVDTSNSAVASGITSAKVTDYDTHIADTDIHVTTEDKTTWNTVTSKAQDSDVVHKSGNETKNGELTLNDTLNTSNIIPNSNNTYECGSSSNIWKDLYSYHGYFRGGQQGGEYSSNTRTNLTLLSNRDTLDESGILFDTYRQNTAQGTGIHILGISIKENSIRYEGCRFSWIWDNNLNGYSFSIRPTLQGTNQAVEHCLGLSTDKWDTINGLNPSALGMPDLDNGIDISSYITVVANANKESLYTPPSNGWISVALTRTSGSHAVLLKQGNFASSGHNIAHENGTTTCNAMLPVKGGVQVSINSALADSVVFAKFYPCQGNV